MKGCLESASLGAGSSPFDSRSNSEPTHLAWESNSVATLVAPVDTHLFSQVLKPGGVGGLEPILRSGGRS